MKNEQQIREMLAEMRGSYTTDAGAAGAVKVRINARRNVLREVLELDDDEAVCQSCHSVGNPAEWPLHTQCSDCASDHQLALDDL